ncbi:MAG: hypothetical protein ACI4NE_04580 [Succinivibrio sp.]
MKGLIDFIFGDHDIYDDDPYAEQLQDEELSVEKEKIHERCDCISRFSGIEGNFGVASFNNTCFFYLIGSANREQSEGYN